MAGDVRETESGPTLDGYEHATGQQKQCYAHTSECVDYGIVVRLAVCTVPRAALKREKQNPNTHTEKIMAS